MLSRIFPRTAHNRMQGLAVAAWLLGVILVVKFLMGANAVVITRSVAASADGLPLASFGPGGEAAVLNLLSLWGLQQALVALSGMVVLLRYRSLMPLMYLFLLLEQAGRKVLQFVHPAPAAAAPGNGTLSIGFIINTALLLALIVGLILSLIARRERTAQAS